MCWKDKIKLGVGRDRRTIDDWVNEIWINYVRKDDMLRKDEFAKFVKTVFKMTNSTYEPTSRQINNLFEMIKLDWGQASKKSMFVFLKNLSRAKPPRPRKLRDDEIDLDNEIYRAKTQAEGEFVMEIVDVENYDESKNINGSTIMF